MLMPKRPHRRPKERERRGTWRTDKEASGALWRERGHFAPSAFFSGLFLRCSHLLALCDLRRENDPCSDARVRFSSPILLIPLTPALLGRPKGSHAQMETFSLRRSRQRENFPFLRGALLRKYAIARGAEARLAIRKLRERSLLLDQRSLPEWKIALARSHCEGREATFSRGVPRKLSRARSVSQRGELSFLPIIRAKNAPARNPTRPNSKSRALFSSVIREG